VIAPNNSASLYELRQVGKRFGKFEALRGINLNIAAGQRVALVGASGAGKSTLLNLLNGSEQPTSGQVLFQGQDLSSLAPRARRQAQYQIGTIYQQFHLINNLAVIHNLNAGNLGRWSLPKAVFSLLRPLGAGSALAALEQVGIPEKLYARVDQLSGGQQQRVAIARVLIQNPQVILADEPVASLDPKRSLEVLSLLRLLTEQAEAGRPQRALISSLHTLEYVFGYFDRVVGLQKGQIMFDLPTSQTTAALLQKLYAEG
jgi:phosphonate transport system ATP-binding protein